MSAFNSTWHKELIRVYKQERQLAVGENKVNLIEAEQGLLDNITQGLRNSF